MSDVLLDWRSLLILNHQRLFGAVRQIDGKEGTELVCRGWPSVGSGWRHILERLCQRVEAAIASEPAARVEFVQIKEKFATLRAYHWSSELSPAAALAVDTAIELAEARSAFVCEQCGQRGHLWDDHGWYRTACDEHGEGRPLAPKPDHVGIEIREHYVGDRRVVTARRYDFDRDAFTPIAVPADYDVERGCWRDEQDEP
jgi:hypothetical protein